MATLIYASIPWFIVTMLVEAAILRREHARGNTAHLGYERRDTVASIAMGFGNLLVSASFKLVTFVLYAKIYEHRLFDIGTGPGAWVLLFFAEDFTYYLWHRASHGVRFLWAAHENHHSSEHFNLSTALRQSFTTPFTLPLFYWWLPLVGFRPDMILIQIALSLLYQYWIHTELIRSLGPLEWILNTPSHHRVHHGSNVQYLDRNHAGVLIVWDRLFGTFEPEVERVRYGLTKKLETYRLLRIGFHEWASLLGDMARAGSLRGALAYALRPPGYSPDGSTLTAHLLRLSTRADSGR